MGDDGKVLMSTGTERGQRGTTTDSTETDRRWVKSARVESRVEKVFCFFYERKKEVFVKRCSTFVSVWHCIASATKPQSHKATSHKATQPHQLPIYSNLVHIFVHVAHDRAYNTASKHVICSHAVLKSDKNDTLALHVLSIT